jgi:D-proline reductase (dithiol) PrdB
MSDTQPVEYMNAIKERYSRLGYQPYRWYHADSPPTLTPLSKPLAQSRLGVLTTAGAYALGQVAFHYKDDTSLRAIDSNTPDGDLRFSHLTENYLVSPRRDPSCVLPLAALRQLREEGAIGSLADDAVSCMGAVYSQRRVREEVIPAVVEAFESQGVEAALLIPM